MILLLCYYPANTDNNMPRETLSAPQQFPTSQEARIIKFTIPTLAQADALLRMKTNNDPALHKLYGDPVNHAAALVIADAWIKLGHSRLSPTDTGRGAMRKARRQLRETLTSEKMEELQPLFKLVKGIYQPSGPGPTRGWARHVRREKSANRT